MKRKILSILLAVTIISSLAAGCGNDKTEDTVSTPQTEAIEAEETTESVDAESAERVESTEAVEATETEGQEITETEAESPYSYTDKSTTMYAQRAVNVRDLPDTSGNKVGGLSTNQEVSVTGQCNETGWYRISYNGSEAFVSDKYLGESKVEVQQTTQSANTQSSDSQSVSSDSGSTASEELPNNPYPLRTLEDNGSSVSYYYLTEAGSGGIDIEMEKQVSLYLLNNGKTATTEEQQFATFIGYYKEGSVWKVTRYYQ